MPPSSPPLVRKLWPSCIRLQFMKLSSIYLLLTSLTTFQGVMCIKITGLHVPELIYLREGFWMNCTYDLESMPLYSVKWFKKNNEVKEEGVWSEIYGYIPNKQRTEEQKVYPTRGIQIDLSKSSQGNVYMTGAEEETEGTFMCEVSTDAPTFETIREEKETRLYHFLQHQPTITGLKKQYMIGEYVNASCTIRFPDPKFKSMTKLTWFINNEHVPPGFVRRLAVPNYPLLFDEDTASSGDLFDASNEMSLPIKFLLKAEHFVDGSMKLRCTASSIPALYTRSAEAAVALLQEPMRGTSFPGRYSSDSNRIRIWSHLSLLVLVLPLISRTGCPVLLA